MTTGEETKPEGVNSSQEDAASKPVAGEHPPSSNTSSSPTQKSTPTNSTTSSPAKKSSPSKSPTKGKTTPSQPSTPVKTTAAPHTPTPPNTTTQGEGAAAESTGPTSPHSSAPSVPNLSTSSPSKSKSPGTPPPKGSPSHKVSPLQKTSPQKAADLKPSTGDVTPPPSPSASNPSAANPNTESPASKSTSSSPYNSLSSPSSSTSTAPSHSPPSQPSSPPQAKPLPPSPPSSPSKTVPPSQSSPGKTNTPPKEPVASPAKPAPSDKPSEKTSESPAKLKSPQKQAVHPKTEGEVKKIVEIDLTKDPDTPSKPENKEKPISEPNLTNGKVAEKEKEKASEETVKDDTPKPQRVLPDKGSARSSPSSVSSIKGEVTKASIRMQTWNKLESNDHVLFPRPCTYRIPRFRGEVEAVENLAALEIFKKARVVKVNLDKAHERLRLEVIQEGKELIAGTPGLREAVFLHMRPPVEPNKTANRMAASRLGIHHLGSALDFSSSTKADLIVLGSVAVDRFGRRIGKGEGFSDLEFALLSKLGAINPGAPIVTLVHDSQVYDKFPEELFKSYDVFVDVIVTPTQVIEVETPRQRPALLWNLLSNRRVNDIPIIQQLLDKEQTSGEKVTLKEVDSEPENMGRNNWNRPLRRKRFVRRQRQSSAPEQREGRSRGAGQRGSSAPPRRSRTFRRKPRKQTPQHAMGDGPDGKGLGEGVMKSPNENGVRGNDGPKGAPFRKGGMRRISRPRYSIDFSVRVNGLNSGVRIRDLKAALIERGVRPADISWRATKGVALLHFAKRKRRPTPLSKENPSDGGSLLNGECAGVEEIVASLQGLTVKREDGGPVMDLSVEAAEPVVRADNKAINATVPAAVAVA